MPRMICRVLGVGLKFDERVADDFLLWRPGRVVADVGRQHLHDRQVISGAVLGKPLQRVDRPKPHRHLLAAKLLDGLGEAVGDVTLFCGLRLQVGDTRLPVGCPRADPKKRETNCTDCDQGEVVQRLTVLAQEDPEGGDRAAPCQQNQPQPSLKQGTLLFDPHPCKVLHDLLRPSCSSPSRVALLQRPGVLPQAATCRVVPRHPASAIQRHRRTNRGALIKLMVIRFGRGRCDRRHSRRSGSRLDWRTKVTAASCRPDAVATGREGR